MLSFVNSPLIYVPVLYVACCNVSDASVKIQEILCCYWGDYEDYCLLYFQKILIYSVIMYHEEQSN
jgi:hypothetical protein